MNNTLETAYTFVMEAFRSLFTLQWSQEPRFQPLPANIARLYVNTAEGDLELLVSQFHTKAQAGNPMPPIFFVHGGEGHAAV